MSGIFYLKVAFCLTLNILVSLYLTDSWQQYKTKHYLNIVLSNTNLVITFFKVIINEVVNMKHHTFSQIFLLMSWRRRIQYNFNGSNTFGIIKYVQDRGSSS